MKYHRLLIVLSLVLILGVFGLSASDFKRGIGGQYGLLSGSGLSYYQQLGNASALQVTAGAYFDGDIDVEYSLGLEYQGTIFNTKYNKWFESSLYWFAGLNHSMSTWPVYDDQNQFTGSYDYIPKIGVGGGFGVEATFFGHFSLPVSIGYALFYETDGKPGLQQFSLGFIAQVGGRYRF